MNYELNEWHVWKDDSKMDHDSVKYSCSPFYAHDSNRISFKP